MSEEEKKAIEILKEIKDVRGIRKDVKGEDEDLFALDIVYNLIENQQKEIEREKQYTDFYKDLCDKQQRKMRELLDNKKEINYIKPIDIPVHNYISKDKIREKIEELESLSKNITMQPSIYNYEIDLLEELLEEN